VDCRFAGKMELVNEVIKVSISVYMRHYTCDTSIALYAMCDIPPLERRCSIPLVNVHAITCAIPARKVQFMKFCFD
jgi:hypothetical protein